MSKKMTDMLGSYTLKYKLEAVESVKGQGVVRRLHILTYAAEAADYCAELHCVYRRWDRRQLSGHMILTLLVRRYGLA